MSDRRGMMPRDDRRRDDDRDHRRRRSRSPRGGRRDDHEVDSYSNSRGYREREREERYGRGGGGGRGEWDRDRRGGRREGERRRDDRRRDFDDRNDRRGYGREDRHDHRQRRDDRDVRMDREDERQLERQGRRSQSPRPRQARQPTPDLTTVTPIRQRQRRIMRWGIRHVDYQNFGGEKAKLTGMFPLPGAPRQQPMDRQRLKDFMDQHSTTNSSALKPSTARQSKRLFVYNIPASTSETTLVDFINLQLNGLNITRSNDPCTTAQLSADKTFAMLEFKTSEDATHAMALDGISMDSDSMGNNEMNGDASGSGRGISIQRPKDYIVPYVTDDTQNEAGVLSDIVPDTQNKICIANIPVFLSEDHIHELLSSFGELKSFVLAKDKSSGQSRGIAFCEYKNAAESTDIAVDGLNDMELGDLHLRVKRASIGVEQKAADMSVSAMSAMAGSDSNGASHHGRVLCLLNMVTPEDLMDPAEADEILGDVEEECEKFGTVLGVKMPRPVAGKQISGVGKIYVKFETSSMAQQALKALAGRKFSDRTVVVTYFGEDYFDVDAF